MTHPKVVECNKLHSSDVYKEKPKPLNIRKKSEPVRLNIENFKNSHPNLKESDFDQFVDIESTDYNKSIVSIR